ncbi:MAG: CotH kinase family protein [Alistipes putredinis]|nr:MAG: CotH kinase family protein [Alistipes putredinis]
MRLARKDKRERYRNGGPLLGPQGFGDKKISVSGDGISWKDAGTLTPHTDWTSTEVTLPAWSGSQLWLKLAAQSTSASVDNIGIYTFAENVSTLVLDKDSITVDNTVDRYVATVRADRDFTVRASEQWITVPQGTVAAGDNVSVTLGFTQNSGTVRSAEVYFTTTDETCTDTLKISQMGRPFHTGHKMLSFGFSKKNNPALKEDIVLSSDGDGFSGRIPYITDVKNLIPTFSSSTMSRVTVNGKEQTSGVTALDFTGKVTYTVTSESGDSTRYEISLIHFTGLPILYINTATGNPVASKSNWEGATLRIEGGPDFDGYPLGEIYVKGRGNSSWGTFTKKQSYNIKLPERSKMLGMPKHKRWSLIGNYRDKTLLRNQVSMELGRKTDLAWVPRGVQVEPRAQRHAPRNVSSERTNQNRQEPRGHKRDAADRHRPAGNRGRIRNGVGPVRRQRRQVVLFAVRHRNAHQRQKKQNQRQDTQHRGRQFSAVRLHRESFQTGRRGCLQQRRRLFRSIRQIHRHQLVRRLLDGVRNIGHTGTGTRPVQLLHVQGQGRQPFLRGSAVGLRLSVLRSVHSHCLGEQERRLVSLPVHRPRVHGRGQKPLEQPQSRILRGARKAT